MAKATKNTDVAPVQSEQHNESQSNITPPVVFNATVLDTSKVPAGCHIYKPGDILPNGNTCKNTLVLLPSLTELRKQNPNLSGDGVKQKQVDLGVESKPAVSAVVNAALADKSFIPRRLSITKDKGGHFGVNLALKQVDTEDLVEKLARIHGKDPNDVRKALGIAIGGNTAIPV